MLKKVSALGVKGITVLFLVSVVSIFCFQNIETISVRFLFWELLSVPKLYLVGVSTLVGTVIGLILGWKLKNVNTRDGVT